MILVDIHIPTYFEYCQSDMTALTLLPKVLHEADVPFSTTDTSLKNDEWYAMVMGNRTTKYHRLMLNY